MDKTYNPHSIEQRWYETWENENYFAPGGKGAPYCIMIPPPNVTGYLHMGHAFQDTIMDALIRYHRMLGDNTLWQVGTDHAGIATQMVVERQLEQEGKTRHDLGRDAFVERVWQWKGESGGNITRQLRRMGASVDWQHERFTMDEGLSKAVQEVFIRLYEEGLIYRGKRLVNWDPVLHTAVSDLEVLSEEEKGHLWHMRYPLTNGTGHLVVATTRPETMLGDAAVAVHPGDERYKHLLGEFVELPLTGRRIPVIADEYVDPEFGTGCVKITPAHDFNDYGVWLRHRDHTTIQALPHGGLINIFTKDATIRENENEEGKLIPVTYVGLDRFAARKKIIADLEAQGLLEKIDDHKLMVPRGDRSGSVIEPFLTDQWYVKAEPLAKPAIEAVEKGDIKFVPDNWKNTYYEWMRNIQDWCISRQIWWGHRIPAWYDAQGNLYVGRSEAEIRQQHKLDASVVLKQDEDVLDTWFSSALWPFSTLGWPDDTERLKTFYPTNVLVTGFDIIFFWVARMIMMGLKFMGDVPFREVYIHGLVRDGEGQKMSKSKGNVLDPIDVIDGIDLEALVKKRTSGMMQPHLAERIEKLTRKNLPDGIPAYGTDALRFTFAALATTGRDVVLAGERIAGYRNFCNKLWNAARYVMMNVEADAADDLKHTDIELSVADKWIISQLQDTIKTIHNAIAGYRFDLMAQSLYDFIWHDYCDWYLELSKPVMISNTSSVAAKRGTRRTLINVLEQLLRLTHPLMPFITEEIWQRVAPLCGINAPSIMRQPYPQVDETLINQQAVTEMQWIQAFILGVRQIRSGMDIKPGKALPVLIQNGSAQDKQRLDANQHYLISLAKLESITWLNAKDEAPESATSLVGEMKLLIPMAGLIDKEAEQQRLGKEIDKKQQEYQRTEAKLSNSSFVDKAPPEVVEKERSKLSEIKVAIEKLQEQLEKISKL